MRIRHECLCAHAILYSSGRNEQTASANLTTSCVVQIAGEKEGYGGVESEY